MAEKIQIEVAQRTNPSFWACFVIVGLVALIWQNIEWIAPLSVLAAVAVGGWVVLRRHERRRRETRERADRQLNWYHTNDPRWITGDDSDKGPQR
jgi:hypothetical protein